jgi:hypothetical protein
VSLIAQLAVQSYSHQQPPKSQILLRTLKDKPMSGKIFAKVGRIQSPNQPQTGEDQ